MIEVSHAERVVFPEIGRTKGDVVAYYERVADRALLHLLGRPLSIRRYPKGLAGAGFFQKNVPAHYPASIERFEVPRSAEATKRHRRKGEEARDATVYPVLTRAEHVPYLANQGAIELHVTTSRVPLDHPDRIVVDLDPPPGELALVRRAALVTRDRMGKLGLPTVPVATGSKGYHVVAPIMPSIDSWAIGAAMQKLGALLEAEHPDLLTTVFRVAKRGKRVFVDWLRNRPLATVVAPYSLRARPRATVATPLTWSEVAIVAPDGFTIDDAERLVERADPLAELARTPTDAGAFVRAVDDAFERAGLTVEEFDRFRS